MGTKEHEPALQAASVAVTSTEVSKISSTNSAAGAANKQNSTHTSETLSSSRINVAKSTEMSSHAANTNYHTTKSVSTTTTTTPHHSKAQVIIIPATPASTVATNAAKKIRRAFSMPRNPFQWSRKFKTSGGGGSAETPDSGDGGGGGRNSALTACVGGGRSGRHGSIVSLNSYTAVCKDTDVGTTDTSTTQTTSHRQEKKNSIAPGSNAGGANRVFRRSSLRKFINRIAQHVSTSVNIGANKHVSSQANSLSSTDRVPPIGGYQWPADQTPGVTGLKNHGNTCFMNAVLQCLSHTDILAEYFVLDQYKSDLKRRNKINSRKFGTKGELTEQLANVLKALWTCKNESDHSTSFKAVVDRYGSQFRSSTQHDAQEFLFWLLDKVHEDLNTATKRRYKSVKNSYGRPDEVIAAETLANHIRCNNSFVQAVFQAQFRSSLTCPRCKKQSNTFDPFHCISVQLPQLTQQTIFVTVLYHKQHPRQVKLGLTVPAGSPIVALREQLHADTGIASERMVLVDINETGFTRVYYDTQPVSTLAGVDTIYCIEVPPEEEKKPSSGDVKTNNEVANATTKPTGANTSASTDLLLLVANMRKRKKPQPNDEISTENENVIERFDMPFCLRVPRDATYAELQKMLLREMSALLKTEVLAFNTPLSEMFKIRLQDPSADPDTYLEQVQHPLLTEMIDLALSVLSAEAGPAHIKLLLEWPEPELHFADINTTPPLVEHESVARLLEQRTQDTAALTLEQCLEHYTKAETLSAEDAWRCPHCQQYLPVVKTLGLWSLPDILVVHFKRFRQHQAKGSNAAKLTTMVKFPLNAFDMAPHLAKGTREQLTEAAFSSSVDHYHNRPSPWRKTTRTPDSRSSTLESNKRETRYDLYAVCYHQGDTLETGHYTAACKNPYDHQWYKFDDQRVSRVPSESTEQDIINNEAYMLFYQRRRTDVAECSGSSSTSGEHWVSKIAPPAQTQTVEKTTVAPTNSVVTAPAAASAKMESVPDNAETKPVDIPKVEVVAIDIPQIPKQEELTQNVVEKVNACDVTDIDGIKYADDGAEDVDVDELDILETLTPNDGTPPTAQETNAIFVMDEECKLNDIDASNESNSLLSTADSSKQQQDSVAAVITPDKSKSPLLPAPATIKSTAANEILKSPKIVPLTNGNSCSTITTPKENNNTSAVVSNSVSVSSSSSSLSSRSSPHSLAASTFGASTLQNKFNGYSVSFSSTTAATNNYKESLLSSSLKSNSSSIIAVATAHANDLHLNQHQYPQNWHGSRSSVSALENVTSSNAHQPPHHTHCLNLRHSFSTSSNFKLKECSDTLSSMLRNSANTCSKDTLIFIDQQNHHHHRHHNHHSLMEDDDDTFMGSRSLWISPVTPHKLITVSPKN